MTTQSTDAELEKLRAQCKQERDAQRELDKREERMAEGDGCVGALALMLAPWVALAVTLIGVWKWC